MSRTPHGESPMIRSIALPVFLAVIVFVLSLLPRDAEGCAAVRRSDRQDPPIRIAEESAIIVWDSVNKVEHFIRRAAFDTKSPDFGFLVPTPGPDLPKLTPVEDSIFRDMDKWILPRIVETAKYEFNPILCMFGSSKARDKKAAGVRVLTEVRVLAEQKVGGYETAILEADNTEALSKWLTDNKYSNDPELQSWLAPYVGAKWRITAFKISQDPTTGKLATTKPVRMSFKTERPFFPYREPESKPTTDAEKKAAQEEADRAQRTGEPFRESRLLRVHFVSATRSDAKLGNAAWHANVKWADQLIDEQRNQIAQETGIALDDLPAHMWLTTFEDTASPRPGKDEVYFDPAPDQTPIRPLDIVHYYTVNIPIDCALICVVLVIGLAGVIIRLRRKPEKPL
jgi:hypothetical protein